MRLSIVVVCYGGDITPLLDALAEQRAPGDEVIVVDNKSGQGGTPGARGHATIDRLIEPEANLHYAAGTNLGTAAANGDTLVLLNPDAVPEPGFLDAMRNPPAEWDGWTGVLTLPDHEHINNGGGSVHFLGLAWSGLYGRPVSELPHGPAPAGFLSGGCLAVRHEVWNALGGYPEDYIAYHEDTDLSLRLRLEGRRFGVLPGARVTHDYDFVKTRDKWRYLERNRWKTVLRTYPLPLLLAVLPALLAAEPALLAAGARRGWGRAKLDSYLDVLRWLPSGLRARRAVQARATAGAGEFAAGLVAELDSPFFGRWGRVGPVQRVMAAYWSAVRRWL